MICVRCKVDKPTEDFYDYDRYKCRECRKNLDRERYPGRKKYLREYYVKWYAETENKNRHYQKSKNSAIEWRLNNKDKVRVVGILNRALKNRLIIKPDHCLSCGKRGEIEAHHPDYTKPLEVLWTCRSCHRLIHLYLD